MRKLLIIFILIISSGCAFSATRHSVINYPIQNQYYNPNYAYRYHLSSKDLSALERYSMNKTYTKEYPMQRLERLENLAFGATQNGDLQTRYKNVEEAILSRPSNAGINVNRRSLLRNMANYFAGQPTGLTPSVIVPNYNTYSPVYGPNYANQRYEQFSNGIFGGGYNLMQQNFGNGSSIRILP